MPGEVSQTTARFFSPVQTRRQRQVNTEIKTNLPAKRAHQVIKNESAVEDSKKVIKLKVGSATIIKCKVVSDFEPFDEKEVSATSVDRDVESPNANWCQQLENIRLMRSEKSAPVDTLGCHQCADKNADEKVRSIEVTL